MRISCWLALALLAGASTAAFADGVSGTTQVQGKSLDFSVRTTPVHEQRAQEEVLIVQPFARTRPPVAVALPEQPAPSTGFHPAGQ